MGMLQAGMGWPGTAAQRVLGGTKQTTRAVSGFEEGLQFLIAFVQHLV